MGTGSVLSTGYQTYKGYRKAKRYYKIFEAVKEAVTDEDKRWGSGFKAVLGISMELATRLLGTSLTSHPYFTYHKVHIEVLCGALNATSTADHATENWRQASVAASRTNEIANLCESYNTRRKGLIFAYNLMLAESLIVARDYRTNPASAAAGLKEMNMTVEQLNAYNQKNVDEWRQKWDALADDALQLQLMAQVQAAIVERAVNAYNEKLKKLDDNRAGGWVSFNKITAAKLREDREWEQYDAAVATGPNRAAMESRADPLGTAQKALTTVQDCAEKIALVADVAMSDDLADDPKGSKQRINRGW